MGYAETCELALSLQDTNDATSAREAARRFAGLADREASFTGTVEQGIAALRLAPCNSLSDGQIVSILDALTDQLGDPETGRGYRALGANGIARTLCKQVIELLDDSADNYGPEIDPDDAVEGDVSERVVRGMEANYEQSRLGGRAA